MMKNKLIFITGGSSGIGKEMSNILEKENKVFSFSRINGFNFLKDDDIASFIAKIKISKPDYLFLNSGIAHFGEFNTISFKDINDIFSVNATANIKIISSLSEEIKEGLKIIVTLSTASYINGAFEAVYNSSKKALKEYIVSVNTELEYKNQSNKIFMFVPHKISGTNITGGAMDHSYVTSIINELIISIDKGEDLFVPRYEEIYKRVFDDYKNAPIEQGLKSIKYKRGE